MTGIVDWAASRARMVLAFIALSIIIGTVAYVSLPKEGEPDIEIPALFVSVPFQGISAEDSEKLLVKVMETELADLDGLDRMSATAAEGYAGMVLEFEFGWDKTKTIADVRDRMNTAEAKFPTGADNYTINEFNFSEFPIIVVNLTGSLPERTLLRLAKDLQDTLEGLDAVLEASLTGQREEMLEVEIDPLRLEAYNVTAAELLAVVQNNNQLIAADQVATESGAFALKIPSAFDEPEDVYRLPVKVNGDRVVTLGDLADIRLTFEDRQGTARFNGDDTIALQVVKRKGFNIIDTAALIRETVAAQQAAWPQELQQAVSVSISMDMSRQVSSMVSQLEGSVLTAIALVMIVVLGALGTRSALLVGFAIPTSFLLCFAFLALMGVSVSNIVMFGLILAVGMLVDGAIVVVEYADRRIEEGAGPMTAFTEAAKRMFWPVVSSTATTLCAFLPMLFWPGVAGEFMGMLPVTLIFVLSASLVVALVYLPVMGGVAGRMSRNFERAAAVLKRLPWAVRAGLAALSGLFLFVSAMQVLNPAYLLGLDAAAGWTAYLPGALMFVLGTMLLSVTLTAAKLQPKRREAIRAGFRRTPFGWAIKGITSNPVMPLVSIGVVGFVVAMTFVTFSQNNYGVEFFVESEPEQAIVYVRARGNHSLEEKDQLLQQAEAVARDTTGIESVFAFAGDGGLNQNTGGASAPMDTIGQIQLELVPWEDRPTVDVPWIFGLTHVAVDPNYDGNGVLDRMRARLDQIPGIQYEILVSTGGPAAAKPVHLRLLGDDFSELATQIARAGRQFDAIGGLTDLEDTRPLPGIDWQIDVDVAEAGRYGADVATVGAMVQLITRGVLLDTMRVDSSDDEIEIRVRFPEEDRVLSTLDTLRVRTPNGLVPLSNFVTRTPVPKLAQISRVDGSRYYDIKAGVAEDLRKVVDAELSPAERTADLGLALIDAEGAVVFVPEGGTASASQIARGLEAGNLATVPVTPGERIAVLTEWLTDTAQLPAGVSWEWTGDQEAEAESEAFLGQAFLGALFLMFIILLAQFNSFYNALLVLVAVVLSTTGVLIGMLVMQQPFSVIMTGTGIVALAGIVVNNNIVLIDTYQEYSKYMPRLEAINRTAQMRIRPVLLTTITTMAGLTPMMLGLSFDFFGGGYSVDSPTALWWTQLATAVVFGLGVATVLTLIFTPAMLALRVWIEDGAYGAWLRMRALSFGKASREARDIALRRSAKKVRKTEIIWDDGTGNPDLRPATDTLRAAE